jgi:hypothetical protein
MTSVDIADIDAALTKVRTFLMLLDQQEKEWEGMPSWGPDTPRYTHLGKQQLAVPQHEGGGSAACGAAEFA